MNYIGKGPNGYYEVLNMIVETARDLQLQGIVNKKIGKMPVIIHDLEYSDIVRRQQYWRIPIMKQKNL